MERKRLIYQFDDVRVDLDTFEVFKGESGVRLEPKGFEALVFLIENRGRLIEKQELLKAVWKEAFVTENAMTRVIAQLRKAIGDHSKQPKYIETVPTRGYRFIAKVERKQSSELNEDAPTLDQRSSEAESVQAALDGGRPGMAVPPNGGVSRGAFLSRHVVVGAGLAALVLSAIGLSYYWISSRQKPTTDSANPRSLAVLPFKPLVSEDRDESLEMGMAETLITKFSAIDQLTVRPINAVRNYADLDQDPLAAGRELGVDLVLEGSFQKSGNRIRITAHLWNVADGKKVWWDKRDHQYTDIFAVQDSIAERVARALALRLSPEAKKHLTKHHTEYTEAYYLFVKGSFHLKKRTVEDTKKAVTYFEAAIDKDPAYARAYAGLADSFAALKRPEISLLLPKEAMAKAKQAALKALELDDTLAEAYISLASIQIDYEWDWESAEYNLNRAIELDPNSSLAHGIYGDYLSIMGKHDEAIAELKRAIELDPLNRGLHTELGNRLYVAGKYDQAIEQFRTAIDMGNQGAIYGIGWAYEQKGMYQEAIAIYSSLIERFGENPVSLSLLGRAYAGAGQKDKAQNVIRDLNERASRGYISPYLLAQVYARLGDKDQTIMWLEKAYENRDEWMAWVKVDPVLDSVHSDRRFFDLLRQMNFAP
jgi:serine/threonine-protein kinase